MPETAAEALKQLLYRGSVKDVYGVEGGDVNVFDFSDRYSIFDWGEMPDLLAGKGEALAVMGDLFFRQLADAAGWFSWKIPEQYPKFWRDSLMSSAVWSQFRRDGVKHHSLGLVDASGISVPLGGRSRKLAVKAFKRLEVPLQHIDDLTWWDYKAYESRPVNTLVPLEIVFRFGAPEGSSFLQRLESISGYAESFGFTERPRAGEWFPFPIVEFFTKLEPTDRFLTRKEAKAVASLTDEELDHLVTWTLLIALRLKDLFAPLGLELWDGKFEFAFTGTPEDKTRSYVLADSIGPDELRLIGPDGVHFSKEFLRRVYRGTPWFQAIEKAKKLAKERGEADWKKICREELGQAPAKLPPEALTAAQALYPSLAEALAKSFFSKSIFPGTPTVQEVCRKLKELG